MRYIRYAILAAIAICLITVALANREMVTLNLLPGEVSLLIGLQASISLPLFIVIFAGISGGSAAWVRLGMAARAQAPRRRRGPAARKGAAGAKRSTKIKTATRTGKDDVLALLEDADAAR